MCGSDMLINGSCFMGIVIHNKTIFDGKCIFFQTLLIGHHGTQCIAFVEI